MKKIIALMLLSYLMSSEYKSLHAETVWASRNQSGLVGSESKPLRKAYIGSTTPIVLEGATTDAFQTTISVSEPTTDNTVTVPNRSGTIRLTSGLGATSSLTVLTGTTTLTAADVDKIFVVGTDAMTVTLPSTFAGARLTFINSGAAGNNYVRIDPNNSDGIYGSITNAGTTTVINTADGEYVENTKATSKRGDILVLIGDGIDGWYISSANGVWAEQTP